MLTVVDFVRSAVCASSPVSLSLWSSVSGVSRARHGSNVKCDIQIQLKRAQILYLGCFATLSFFLILYLKAFG